MEKKGQQTELKYCKECGKMFEKLICLRLPLYCPACRYTIKINRQRKYYYTNIEDFKRRHKERIERLRKEKEEQKIMAGC